MEINTISLYLKTVHIIQIFINVQLSCVLVLVLNSRSTTQSINSFVYKEVVFFLACCTVCNILTLLSLFSFTICLAPFSHLFLQSSLFSFCNAHMVAHHTFFFVFVWSFPPSFLWILFSPFSFLMSLSVMAYQDGFYGAADLYVSMPLSLLPHITPPYVSPSACGFSSVRCHRPNPWRCVLLSVLAFFFSYQGIILSDYC